MSLIKRFNANKLDVRKYSDRLSMARAAADDIIAKIKDELSKNDEINMIFAAAPSQAEVLDFLTQDKEIEWNRVNAYHMDEYIGLAPDAPQGFGNFLKRYIFDKLPFKNVYLINGNNEVDKEVKRYTELINVPVHIVCLGIGENGHIAFNDPPVADFNDSAVIKPVTLDEKCRNQQVNDGCFAKIEDVPKTALTLTIPALLSGKTMFCVVPAKTKADAVRETVSGIYGETCPASALTRHDNAILYVDSESGMYI